MTYRCGNSFGVGIGAGHECICKDQPNHQTRHWCECGAVWGVGYELSQKRIKEFSKKLPKS